MSGDVFTLADLDRVLAKIKDAGGMRPMSLDGRFFINTPTGVRTVMDFDYCIHGEEIHAFCEDCAALQREETSMDKSVVTNGAQLIIGNGQPIGFPAAGLHTTCPTCSRVFPIDVLDEGSARQDIAAYVEHTDACRAEKTQA